VTAASATPTTGMATTASASPMAPGPPRVERERGAGALWAWGAVVMLVVAVGLRQVIVFYAAAVLLGVIGVSAWWGAQALDRVTYRRVLSRRVAWWGEGVTLRIEADNDKRLPLPWLRIADDIPALPLSTRLQASGKAGRRQLPALFSVLGYQRVARTYTVTCTTRGEHTFGPAALRAGDIFGLSTATTSLPVYDTLLIYPKVVPLTMLDLPASRPFGDRGARRRLFEDPLRSVGVRDYVTGDSPRHVHWKTTAHTGTLQVRVFEPVRTLRAALFLDVATGRAADAFGVRRYLGYDTDLLELAIVTAASIAVHLLADGFEVGLYANGGAARQEGLVRLAPSATADAATTILTALALLPPMPTLPLSQMLAEEAPRLPLGADAVIVSAAPTAELLAAAGRLRAEGHTATLIAIGEDAPPPAPPGVVVRLAPARARDWRALAALDLG